MNRLTTNITPSSASTNDEVNVVTESDEDNKVDFSSMVSGETERMTMFKKYRQEFGRKSYPEASTVVTNTTVGSNKSKNSKSFFLGLAQKKVRLGKASQKRSQRRRDEQQQTITSTPIDREVEFAKERIDSDDDCLSSMEMSIGSISSSIGAPTNTNFDNTISEVEYFRRMCMEDDLEGGDDNDEMSNASSHKSGLHSSYTSLQDRTCQVVDLYLVDNLGNAGMYTGTLEKRARKPHGNGCMIYDNGSQYDGQWVKGDWSGFGTLKSRRKRQSVRLQNVVLPTTLLKRTKQVVSDDEKDEETQDLSSLDQTKQRQQKIVGNGDFYTYQGGFLDNLKHGLGVIEYDDGRIYDGTFQLDKIGKGRMTYVDGSKFWGSWSDEGLPEGRGKFELPDGTVYDGEFHGGTIHGHGRMTLPDGSWYLGEWCDGEKNGLGLEVLGDGTLVFEGIFTNGKPAISSSIPVRPKSEGSLLLYRSSVVITSGTLVGPLPAQLYMRKGVNTMCS